jgi:hypothetical protein
MPSWADLNERQQKYMQEIYNQDQENERYERGIANCFVSDFWELFRRAMQLRDDGLIC